MDINASEFEAPQSQDNPTRYNEVVFDVLETLHKYSYLFVHSITHLESSFLWQSSNGYEQQRRER